MLIFAALTFIIFTNNSIMFIVFFIIFITFITNLINMVAAYLPILALMLPSTLLLIILFVCWMRIYLIKNPKENFHLFSRINIYPGNFFNSFWPKWLTMSHLIFSCTIIVGVRLKVTSIAVTRTKNATFLHWHWKKLHRCNQKHK